VNKSATTAESASARGSFSQCECGKPLQQTGIPLGPVCAMLRRLPLLLIAFLAPPLYAYTPAVNSTAQGVADTEDSTITLKWPSGTFQETISYQLAASGSMGISKVCLLSCRSEESTPD
jgi:hypothetical protein